MTTTQAADERFAGHTAGPWEVHDPGPYDLMQVRGQPDEGSDGPKICDVNDIGGYLGDYEANARLIAAAPALLADNKALAERVRELEEAVATLLTAVDEEANRRGISPELHHAFDIARQALGE